MRKRKINFSYLLDDQNRRCSWGNALERLIEDYFGNLFCLRGSDAQDVLGAVIGRVSTQQNERLCQLFTATKVKGALRSMNPDKSPGSDGFNLCFYQTYWLDICEKNQIGWVLEVFCIIQIVLLLLPFPVIFQAVSGNFPGRFSHLLAESIGLREVLS
ncbi:hypothetical protein LguiA_007038 [Lonicera macranthoides]